MITIHNGAQTRSIVDSSKTFNNVLRARRDAEIIDILNDRPMSASEIRVEMHKRESEYKDCIRVLKRLLDDGAISRKREYGYCPNRDWCYVYFLVKND